MQKNAESSFKKLTDATGLNDPRHSEVEDKFAHAFQDYCRLYGIVPIKRMFYLINQ